jgi:predicted nucleotide-binding protein (sugar kinase/HSP70/actin superfamily)
MKYKLGRENVLAELHRTLKPFGYSKRHIASALTEAYSANAAFKEALLQRGTEAMEILEEKDETGIILVGRPYNIYDFGSNISIPDKLRKYYGVNLIPLDFMPLEDIDISEVNENMYWGYGRKIIAAARYAFRKDNLHLIYITNFKCGPDSYIKHFVVEASGKPYLTLQFDGHANDAGIMTRCEAYLESKGMLRWWDEE